MRMIYKIVASVVLLSSVACTKWLSIDPSDTITEEYLFEEAAGYRNALNGVYKQMSSTEMYGREMSYGAVDILGGCYVLDPQRTTHVYTKMGKDYNYNDSEVKTIISNIWSKSYNTITNCNNIIQNIENEDVTIFKEGKAERDLILGEALAVRAYIHLDLLRLFAPSVGVNDGNTYIPYHTTYPAFTAPKLSVNAILDKCIEDLLKAKELLKTFDLDPEHRYGLSNQEGFKYNPNSSMASKDLFFSSRRYRMNYYAVIATLARVYSYYEKEELALPYITEIKEAKESQYSVTFTFNSNSQLADDNKFRYDVIFTLSDEDAVDDYFPYLPNTLNDYSHFRLMLDYDNMFAADKGDYRSKKVELMDQVYVPMKFKIPAALTTWSINTTDMFPMIRMGEMYLIEAEAHAASGDYVAAVAAIDALRIGRGCTTGLVTANDQESFEKLLLEEAHRELYSEGQLLYFIKKYNKLTVNMTSQNQFVLSTPDNENIN